MHTIVFLDMLNLFASLIVSCLLLWIKLLWNNLNFIKR